MGFRVKSDLRNHQAIVQPRVYDSLMVTQITLKTEGPHGLPSGRQTEVDPLYRGLIISTVYDSGHASHPRGLSLCANATARERGGRWFTRLTSATPGQGLRIKPGGTRLVCFAVEVSLAGIDPVGFRIKPYRGLIILTVYDCGHAFQSLPRTEPCANATARERGEPWFTRLTSATPGRGEASPGSQG